MAKTKDSQAKRETTTAQTAKATVRMETAKYVARMLGSVDMAALDGKGRMAVTRTWLALNGHARRYDEASKDAYGKLTTDADRELLQHVDDDSDPQRRQEARRRGMELDAEVASTLAPMLAEEIGRTWPTLDTATVEALAGANPWQPYQLGALIDTVGE